MKYWKNGFYNTQDNLQSRYEISDAEYQRLLAEQEGEGIGTDETGKPYIIKRQIDPEYENNQKRGRRKEILKAFDIWEKCVLRGRETDDYEVMIWYRRILDLDSNALDNIPQVVKKYMK